MTIDATIIDKKPPGMASKEVATIDQGVLGAKATANAWKTKANKVMQQQVFCNTTPKTRKVWARKNKNSWTCLGILGRKIEQKKSPATVPE